jgi:PAS domain S-box-containing protein
MMNSSSVGNLEKLLTIGADQLPLIFPFYLVFDHELRVVSCGPSLQRSCPDVQPGVPLGSVFVLERPRIPLNSQALQSAASSLFVWKHVASEYRLRGQLVVKEDAAFFLFLGSPLIREPERLHEWNLTLRDFAVHDATPEFTQFVVSQRLAMADFRRISEKLERQRAELRRSLDEIRAGEEKRQLLALVVSHSANAVVVTDARGRIEWVNESFSQLTGYSVEEVWGKRPGALLQGARTDGNAIAFMRECIAAQQSFRCEVANYRRDGTLFWNAMEVRPLLTESGGLRNFFGILYDVTAKREAAARSALELKLTAGLGLRLNLEESMLWNLRVLGEATGGCYARFWLLDEHTECLHLRQAWASAPIRDSETGQKSLRPGEGVAGRAFAEDSLVVVESFDSPELAGNQSTAWPVNVRSALGFPVRVAGVPAGVIEILFHQENGIPSFFAGMAESTGVQIGQSFESRMAEAERDRLLSLLQSALESTPEGVVVSDLSGNAFCINHRWHALLGFTGSVDPEHWQLEFMGRLCPTRHQLYAWRRQETLTDESITTSYSLVGGKTIEVVTNPHRHLNTTVGQLWLFRDISGRLAAQQDRERLLATLNATLEATNEGILVTGLRRKRLAWNRRFFLMWRIDPTGTELDRDKDWSQVPFPFLKEPKLFARIVTRLFHDISATLSERLELTDGKTYDFFTQPLQVGSEIIGRVWSYRDVSAQQGAFRELQASREGYRFVVETAPDLILTFDFRGIVRFANQIAVHRLGGAKSGLVGETVSRFFPEAKRRVYRRLLGLLLEHGVTWRSSRTLNLMLTDWQGTSFPAEVHIDQSTRGDQRQFTAVIRDVSARKNIEAQVRQAARAAELANRAKTDFLANMSHEIRTPLNAIVGLSELLREETLSRDVREVVDSIWVNAESLLGLVNDLLDVSKIEAGQIDLECQDFDAAEISEGAVDAVRVRAAAKSLEVYLVVEPPNPPTLRGDPNRIRQVLINLLSNAVKFTVKGHVTLRLCWEPNDSGVVLKFSVTDTGVGIAESERSLIFESFYRVSSPLDGNSGGVGLGLAISLAISKRLGGTLSVESSVGKGSRFSLVLPPMPAVECQPAEASGTAEVLLATLPDRMETQLAVLRSAGMKPHPCVGPDDWSRALPRFPRVIVDEEWAELHQCTPGPANEVLWLRMTGRSAKSGHVPLLVSPLTPLRLKRAIEAMGVANVTDGVGEKRRHMPSKSQHILLVEDNPAAQLHMGRLLAANGYVVSIGSTAVEALDMLRGRFFDMVLMDIQLPDGNGIEVIRQFRALEQTEMRPRTPVVVLSAHALLGFETEARNAGADSYLAKPIRQKELLDALRHHLIKRSRVVVFAADGTTLAKISPIFPQAAPLVFSVNTGFDEHKLDGMVDVAILAATSPSREFVESALQLLARKPSCRLLLMGADWESELVELTTCSTVSPIPESAEDIELLLERLLPQQERSPEWRTLQQLDLEIATVTPQYLDGLLRLTLAIQGGVGAIWMEEVARFAHRLKGTGSAYGFPDLTMLAAELEAAATARDAESAAGLLRKLERDISSHARMFLSGITEGRQSSLASAGSANDLESMSGQSVYSPD